MSSFPDNVIELLALRLQALQCVDRTVIRSLNPMDAHQTAGIEAMEWAAVEYEMMDGMPEPSICEYTLAIQHVVLHAEQEAGQKLHRDAAKSIRLMLYRDQGFVVPLRQIKEVAEGRVERILKWKVNRQAFASNEISGNFVSMSATEFSFQTETATA